MKKVLFGAIVAVVLVLSMCSFAQLRKHVTGQRSSEAQYQLVFSDDFNQKDGTQPDPKVWQRSVRGTSRWNRWISNSPEVVFIRKGSLVCRAIPNTHEQGDTAAMLTGRYARHLRLPIWQDRATDAHQFPTRQLSGGLASAQATSSSPSV